jgi:hypothetical protein
VTSPRRCSARRADGQLCRGRPLRDSDPPLCAAHADRATIARGFYRRLYTLAEIADLADETADQELEDEVAAARLGVRRVMEQLEQKLPPADYARLAGLLFRGTSTVAHLLQVRRALGSNRKAVRAAINQAVGELGDEWGIDLRGDGP